jgi:uncharacterized delta-60 repeat protein
MNEMQGSIKIFILLFFPCFICMFEGIPIGATPPPEQMWCKIYDGPLHDGDDTSSVVVDDFGFVYVTGRSFRSGNWRDVLTVKYDPNGQLLWEALYNGPVNGDDAGLKILLDDSGFIYVSGISDGGATDWDYLTIKYTSDGNEVWATRYNGPSNGMDGFRDLVLDDSGNAYVTGFSQNGPNFIDFDIVTVKYDVNGEQLWAKRYDSGINLDDYGYAICVDPCGCVYVTGSSESLYEDTFIIIKYSPDGNELWIERPHDSGIHSSLEGRKIAADGFGAIVDAGLCDNTLNESMDFAIFKYGSDGNRTWARYYDSGDYDEIRDLFLDDSGNVYVAGDSWADETFWNCAIVKYDANGNELWDIQYDSGSIEGNKRSDFTSAIAVDHIGNIYVAGTTSPQNSSADYFTLSYSQDGQKRWIKAYGRPVGYEDSAHDLDIDNRGSIYVTGESYHTAPDCDAVTIKYTEHYYCVAMLGGDRNGDCKVNFLDYAVMANNWLISYDITDIAIIANNWLKCNYALGEDCW